MAFSGTAARNLYPPIGDACHAWHATRQALFHRRFPASFYAQMLNFSGGRGLTNVFSNGLPASGGRVCSQFQTPISPSRSKEVPGHGCADADWPPPVR